MIRNNQNGRRRGRGGARPQQGGGPSGNYGNNSGGGSRIDTRQRGNATQLLEKYKAMARDATQNGDRVQAEFYMQYADHYFRVVNEFRPREAQPAARSGYDDDEYDTPLPGQTYPQQSYADDDGDDDRRETVPERNGTDRQGGSNGADRSGGSTNGGGERYAARGNDRYRSDGQAPAEARDRRPERDDRGSRDRGYTGQRDGVDGGSAREDATREPRREMRDQGRDTPRYEPRPRTDSASVQGDGGRDASRRDDRSYAAREVDSEADATVLIGLPGPATVAPVPAASPTVEAPPMIEGVVDEAPVPRRRGRPRKVVVVDAES